MVINSPCLIDNKELTSPEQTAPALASPKQTAIGKDYSNPLMAGSLPKTILCVNCEPKRIERIGELKNRKRDVEKQTGVKVSQKNERLIFGGLLKLLLTDNWEDVLIMTTIDGHYTVYSLKESLRTTSMLDVRWGSFSPQWRFLFNIFFIGLRQEDCLGSQFSSNIATAVICSFNFASYAENIFQQHSKTYHVPSLSNKVFNNMKRPTKGYSGQEVALFPTMLDVTEPSTSASRITSSPSPSPEPQHSPEPSPQHSPEHTTASPTQPSPGAEHPMTHLSMIGVLEDDLRKTKKTYSSAFTKLILRVKKLEFLDQDAKQGEKARIVIEQLMAWSGMDMKMAKTYYHSHFMFLDFGTCLSTILQISSAIRHISNIDNMYIKSYSFSLFSSLPVSHSLWSSQSFGHQKAINGFDMPLPVAVCSGLVNPLAPRKGVWIGGGGGVSNGLVLGVCFDDEGWMVPQHHVLVLIWHYRESLIEASEVYGLFKRLVGLVNKLGIPEVLKTSKNWKKEEGGEIHISETPALSSGLAQKTST
ncbi:hypothetical protein Tco_0328752 [Tanacetum coccineum]